MTSKVAPSGKSLTSIGASTCERRSLPRGPIPAEISVVVERVGRDAQEQIPDVDPWGAVTSAIHAVRYPFEASTVTIEPAQYLGPVSRVAFFKFVDRGLEDMTVYLAFEALHDEHEAERVDGGGKAGAGEAQDGRAPEGSLVGCRDHSTLADIAREADYLGGVPLIRSENSTWHSRTRLKMTSGSSLCPANVRYVFWSSCRS